MSESTEKTTERIAFEYLTGNGIKYNQNKNRELFGKKMPDGWKLLNSSLLILEFKKDDKDKNAAAKQLFAYYRLAQTKKPELKEVFGIIITGTSPEGLRVYAYKFSPNKMAKINVNEVFSVFATETDPEKFKYIKNTQYIHDSIVKNFNINESNKLYDILLIIILSFGNSDLIEIYEKKTENEILNSDFKRLLIENAKANLDEIDRFKPYLEIINDIDLLNIFQICKIIYYTFKYSYNTIADLLAQFKKYYSEKTAQNDIWTNKEITEIMFNELKPFCREILDSGQKLSVLDPCIGGGNLVQIFADTYGAAKITINGCDINKQYIMLDKFKYIIDGINFNLLSANFMELDDITKEKIRSHVCICNPPYTKKLSGYYAIDFLRQATECAAVCCFIFPAGNLNNDDRRTIREEILKNHYVYRCLSLGSKVFYQNTKIIGTGEIVILVTVSRNNFNNFPAYIVEKIDEDAQRSSDSEKRPFLTEFIDLSFYSDERKKIPHGGFKLSPVFMQNLKEYFAGDYLENHTQKRALTDGGSWIQSTEAAKVVNNVADFRDIIYNNWKNARIAEFVENINLIIDVIKKNADFSVIPERYRKLAENFKKRIEIFELKRPIKYALSDLFEPITVKRFNLYKSEEGEIPLFGATNKNKPVKFIKNISYTVTEEEKGQIVTINKNGSGAGYCFRKDLGPFSITHDVNCYRLKRPLTDEDLDTISIQLNKIFNFHHNLNAKRFFETFVYLFEF